MALQNGYLQLPTPPAAPVPPRPPAIPGPLAPAAPMAPAALRAPLAPMAPAAPAAPAAPQASAYGYQQARPVQAMAAAPQAFQPYQPSAYVPSANRPGVAAAPAAQVPGQAAVQSFLGSDVWNDLGQLAAALLSGAGPGRDAAGGVRNAQVSVRAARAMRAQSISAATRSGGSFITSGILSAVKTSLLIKGGISLVENIYKVYTGAETRADAAANITGDVVSAGVSGVAAGLASAAATSLLVGVVGTGFALTALGCAVGAVAFFAADGFLRQTSLFNSLKTSAYNMFR